MRQRIHHSLAEVIEVVILHCNSIKYEQGNFELHVRKQNLQIPLFILNYYNVNNYIFIVDAYIYIYKAKQTQLQKACVEIMHTFIEIVDVLRIDDDFYLTHKTNCPIALIIDWPAKNVSNFLLLK